MTLVISTHSLLAQVSVDDTVMAHDSDHGKRNDLGTQVVS